jgi:predicted ArsR family transcriptional regulator
MIATDHPSIKERIRAHMADGQQRTTAQLAFDLRISEATAARELRKLRRELGAPVQMARLRGPARPAVFWLPQPAGQE